MDCRHGARNRYRMAEISVPAWPMPTQNTKVVMYTPHPTGLVSPLIPRPNQMLCSSATTIRPTRKMASPSRAR